MTAVEAEITAGNGDVKDDANDAALVVLGRDAVMARLVKRYGARQLRPGEPFLVLARSVIAQQISTKAADTIRAKLLRRFGTDPSSFCTLDPGELQAYGLTRTKSECLVAIAGRVSRGELIVQTSASDAEIVACLRQTKGIGPWTAQMFLIFCLARPDVWPVSDAGLRTAARTQYRIDSVQDVEGLGVRFAPFRSLAAVYLWKSLENTTSAAR